VAWSAGKAGTARRGGDRKHGEAVLRVHHRVIGIGKALRQQHQQFVRTVTQRDAGYRHAELARQTLLQRGTERIGITPDVFEHARGGTHRKRAWAKRVLVGTEFGQHAAELQAQCRKVMTGIVGTQRRRRPVGERGCIERGGHGKATG
jgi:hypothetical protein